MLYAYSQLAVLILFVVGSTGPEHHHRLGIPLPIMTQIEIKGHEISYGTRNFLRMIGNVFLVTILTA